MTEKVQPGSTMFGPGTPRRTSIEELFRKDEEQEPDKQEYLETPREGNSE